MRGANSTSRPGIRVNTDSKLSSTAFIKTIAMSRPTENFINPSAIRPLMVVREEAEISGIALDSAAIQASRTGRASCSSENLWHKIMA